jgi:hypothetical protein
MITSLLKAAAGVITVPVAVIADAVTLGGALNEQPEPYTARAVSDVLENLAKATDPDED